MIPNNFEYFAPKTIEEALMLIDKYGEDCKILSGGHSLIPVLKLRLTAPAVIIDIGRIEELKTIEVNGGIISIGGGVTHAGIAADAELKRYCPLCEFAVVGVAAQIRIAGGECEDVGIGVTGLAPKAFRAASVEAALRGRTLNEATLSAAAARADAEVEDAMEDIHASGDYRRHLARVYVRRAVQAAAARM